MRSGCLSDIKIPHKLVYYENYSIQYHVAVCATLSRTDNEPAVGL